MPSFDGPGAAPKGLGGEGADEQVSTQLVEALILLLVEKGVLTKNDTLSIVQTVAQVQKGATEAGNGSEPTAASLQFLQRLYLSFDALAGRSGAAVAEAENVRQLRPPIYDGRPEFPGED